MEPTTQPTESNIAIETEPWYAPLNRVTILSKITAVVVLVTLPCVGFLVGYEQGVSLSVSNASEDADIIMDEISARDIPNHDVNQKFQPPDQISVESFPAREVVDFGRWEDWHGDLVSTKDGLLTYFVRLPYEGVRYSKLYYRTNNRMPDNGFEQNRMFYSVPEAGLISPRRWPISPDGRYMAFAAFNDKAYLYCDQARSDGDMRVSNVIKVLDVETGPVRTIRDFDALDDIYKLEWSSTNTIDAYRIRLTENTEVSPDNLNEICAITTQLERPAAEIVPDEVIKIIVQ